MDYNLAIYINGCIYLDTVGCKWPSRSLCNFSVKISWQKCWKPSLKLALCQNKFLICIEQSFSLEYDIIDPRFSDGTSTYSSWMRHLYSHSFGLKWWRFIHRPSCWSEASLWSCCQRLQPLRPMPSSPEPRMKSAVPNQKISRGAIAHISVI